MNNSETRKNCKNKQQSRVELWGMNDSERNKISNFSCSRWRSLPQHGRMCRHQSSGPYHRTHQPSERDARRRLTSRPDKIVAAPAPHRPSPPCSLTSDRSPRAFLHDTRCRPARAEILACRQLAPGLGGGDGARAKAVAWLAWWWNGRLERASDAGRIVNCFGSAWRTVADGESSSWARLVVSRREEPAETTLLPTSTTSYARHRVDRWSAFAARSYSATDVEHADEVSAARASDVGHAARISAAEALSRDRCNRCSISGHVARESPAGSWLAADGIACSSAASPLVQPSQPQLSPLPLYLRPLCPWWVVAADVCVHYGTTLRPPPQTFYCFVAGALDDLLMISRRGSLTHMRCDDYGNFRFRLALFFLFLFNVPRFASKPWEKKPLRCVLVQAFRSVSALIWLIISRSLSLVRRVLFSESWQRKKCQGGWLGYQKDSGRGAKDLGPTF